MKEFDLSKKIYDIDTCPIFSDERRVINVFHIKEFIKLLKERYCMFSDLSFICKTCGNEKRYFMRDGSMCFDCYIDKLAGEILK